LAADQLGFIRKGLPVMPIGGQAEAQIRIDQGKDSRLTTLRWSFHAGEPLGEAMARRNPCIETALDELRARGIQGRVVNSRKGVRVEFEFNGRTRFISMSKTPSCPFADRHVRADVRKIMAGTY
jgi:hypothetical protein